MIDNEMKLANYEDSQRYDWCPFHGKVADRLNFYWECRRIQRAREIKQGWGAFWISIIEEDEEHSESE